MHVESDGTVKLTRGDTARLTISITNDLTQSVYKIEDSSYPLTNAVGKGSANDTYAQWSFPEKSANYSRVMYDFDTSVIPSNATIESIQCVVKSMLSNITSQAVSTRTVKLCSFFNGAYNIFGSGTVPSSFNEFTLQCNTITREELNACYIDFITVRGKKVSSLYQRFYGASLTITYAATGPTFLMKNNGTLNNVNDVYEKANGVCIKQSNIQTIFDTNTKYVNGN